MSETTSSRARVPCKFKCLCCSLIYDCSFIEDVMEEHSCPECGSNSQWQLKEKKKKPEKEAAAE